MRNWLRYFFQTPQRAVWTLTVVGLITVIIFPGLGPVLAIIIVLGGLRMILFGRK